MPNAINNSSFEVNTTGWGLDADYERSNADSYDGSWSIKQTSTSDYRNFTTVNDGSGIDVLPNTEYEFSFYAKVNVVSGYAPIVRLADGADPYDNYDYANSSIDDTSNKWVKQSFNFTTTASTTKVAIRIVNNDGEVNAFYDLFSIETVLPHPTTLSEGAASKALLDKKYMFIVESDNGKQQLITEKWDFNSISRQINGSSVVNITTNVNLDEYNDGTTDLNNAVTIRVATDNTGSQGMDYFSGYIAQSSLDIRNGKEKVTLQCVGHIGKLYKAIWRNGTTIVHNYTGETASNIAKDIIDHYRTLDSNMRVNYDNSVEDSSTSISDTFEGITFGQGLDNVIERAYTDGRIWYWRVLGDDTFTFKKNSQSADHRFILGKHVTDLSLQEDLVNSVNEVFTYYNNTATRRIKNASNITTYGYNSEFRRETNATDSTTADVIGNAVLEAKIPPILKFNITVSSVYDIESIDPGDTCEILNIPENIRDMLSTNMFITKTNYSKDKVELELAIKHSRIESELTQLQKNFHRSRTEGMPSTYTDV